MFKLANTLTFCFALFASTGAQPVKGPPTIMIPEPMPPLVGGQQDANHCMIGAGYSWCQSSQSCVRKWEVPCADDYNDCPDCLSRQRKGENIACPMECNMIVDPGFSVPWGGVPGGPMIDLPVSAPAPPQIRCPQVMCMMYCENGFDQDHNGCNTCSCLTPVVDYARPMLGQGPTHPTDPIRPTHHTDPIYHPTDTMGPPGSIIDPGPCPIPYVQCQDEYVCPKVQEMTQCSQGGIQGYTTYRLSLVIQDSAVQNIYAIYGDDQSVNHPLDIPPAYQGQSIFNSNLGGIAPEIVALNPASAFDSWLTIGLTNGDPDNKISMIGLDMDSWTETEGIHTTNGAVFSMDPEEVIVQGREYVIAQLTIPTNHHESVIINVQGKMKAPSGQHSSNTWQSEGIIFNLEPPQSVDPNVVPDNCVTWYDGCNTCYVSNGIIGGCTRMMCFREDAPHCASYATTSGGLSGH